jgi:hypothetical protein
MSIVQSRQDTFNIPSTPSSAQVARCRALHSSCTRLDHWSIRTLPGVLAAERSRQNSCQAFQSITTFYSSWVLRKLGRPGCFMP